MKDEKEKIRKFFNMQYVKMKRVAAVGSMILLAINLTLTLYQYIEHRDIHPYIGIPILFVAIMLVILLCAHIYVKKMEMYRTEAHAEVVFNPFSVYAFSPFEEMMYTNSIVPIMEAMVHLLPKGSDERKTLDIKSKKFRRWCEMGYIPKDEFPDKLKEYYITNMQRRL